MITPEIAELMEVIELLKQELLLLIEKQEKDYRLLNDRLDEIAIKLSDK